MGDYIQELRKEIGNRPLILSTAGVVLIDDEDRLLMQYRGDNNTWGLPGGAIELGETVEEAAIREVLEETGLTVSSMKLFDIYSGHEQHYIYPNGDEVYMVCIMYYSRNFKGTISIDGDETKDIKFFDVNELPDKISPPVIPIVKDIIYKINNKLI
jgi:8-oxo-dGTP pyrophosphatase MutT (NUDIX family)